MDNVICEACQKWPLSTSVMRRRGLCDACARRTGLWLAPPELRPSRPCQRCGSSQFVASQLRDRAKGFLAPMAFALANTDRGEFATTDEAEPWAPMGILIAFACRGCGLTELYTLEADRIPIGPEYGTYLVDCTPQDGPLR